MHDDPILQRAYERMEELDQELGKLKDFVSTYRMLANGIKLESANILGTKVGQSSTEDLIGDTGAQELARETFPREEAAPRRTRVTDNPKPDVVVQAALALIREMRRPLTRREIHKGLGVMGLEVKGADPVKTLGTMLWRSGSELLEQIEGRGYWPKGEPVPPPTLRELAGNRPLALRDPDGGRV